MSGSDGCSSPAKLDHYRPASSWSKPSRARDDDKSIRRSLYWIGSRRLNGPSLSAFPGQHKNAVSNCVLKTVAPCPTSLHLPAPRALQNTHLPLLQRQQANNRHFLLRPATTRPLLPFRTPSNALIRILTCVCSFLLAKDTADAREQHSHWVAAGPDVCYRYPRHTSGEEEGGRVE